MSFDKIIDVKVMDIEISPQNVRRSNATQDLDELAASIEKHGLLEPVVLRGNPNDSPPFHLIAGQRRFLAHEKLKRNTIRAVFAGKISDREATILSLIENLQSVDLNHADTAKAITELYKKAGKNEREVVKDTGLSLRKIRDYISIEAQASPKMKSQLRENKVSPADVKRALRAAQGNLKKAEQLLELMEEYQLTKHQKKRIVEFSETNPRATAKKIVEEARRYRIEQSILVSLPEDVRKGLERATKNLSKEPEEIVADILHDWLANQGFIGA
jgi:ParB family chromosome partitioning protein